jgi:hypothetical protein
VVVLADTLVREWRLTLAEALEMPLSRAWICMALSLERLGLRPAQDNFRDKDLFEFL